MDRAKLLAPNIAIYTLFFFAWIVGRIFSALASLNSGRKTESALLAIEAGEAAWEHIFFQELDASAREFFGENGVVRLSVKSKKTYVRELRELILDARPTHYFFDPRTGSPQGLRGIIEAFAVLIILSRSGVVPIAYCTDISVRRDRFKAAIVTAVAGVCVNLSSPVHVRQMFPHTRLVGPAIMPISKKTALRLRRRAESRLPSENPRVAFYGSLYEPRTTQLEAIRRALADRSIPFDIQGRAPGEERITTSQYWADLINTDIAVSTSSQVSSRGMDNSRHNHLIYRYTEALACGSCLVIERAPGYEDWFEHGKNVMVWDTPTQAADLIELLIGNQELRDGMRSNALDWVKDVTGRNDFWDRILTELSEPCSP